MLNLLQKYCILNIEWLNRYTYCLACDDKSGKRDIGVTFPTAAAATSSTIVRQNDIVLLSRPTKCGRDYAVLCPATAATAASSIYANTYGPISIIFLLNDWWRQCGSSLERFLRSRSFKAKNNLFLRKICHTKIH